VAYETDQLGFIWSKTVNGETIEDPYILINKELWSAWNKALKRVFLPIVRIYPTCSGPKFMHVGLPNKYGTT
jgi:hypothetical protein